MNILPKNYRITFSTSILVIASLVMVPFLLNSCTEDEALEVLSKLLPVEDIEISDELLGKVVYGPEKFISDNSDVTVIEVEMSSLDFSCHQAPYSVIVVNGEVDGSFLVNEAKVLVDNIEIFNHSDFRIKVERLADGVSFDATSTLRVELTGGSGNYVNIYFIGEKEEQSELVAYYHFNGNADSESCPAPNGVEMGGVSLTEDRFCNENSAYLFDGDDDKISFGTINDVYTLSMWFYNPTEITKDNFYGNLLQLDSGNPDGAGGISWGNSADEVDGEIVIFRNSGTGTNYFYWTNTESIPVGWHHQVIVWDTNEDGYRLYLDNVDLGIAAFSGIPILEKDFNMFEIGSNTESWGGKVDDIKMYNYGLLIEEVTALYLEKEWNGNCSSCATVDDNDIIDPIAYFPFSGNADDASSNNNNGLIHGAVLTTDRFGNPNYAYHFDGIDDYINFGSDNSLKVSDAISISVWLKPEESPNYPQILIKEGEYKLALYPKHEIGYTLTNTSPGWKNQVTAVTADLNQWTHVVLVYSANLEKIQLYKNNKLVHEQVGIGSIGDYHSDYNELWIGFRHRSGSNSDYFHGDIDDVRLFDYALSLCEVEALFRENGWTGE